MRVEWRARARQDALDIANYIEIDDPAAAVAVCEEIDRGVAMLAEFPNMGRLGRLPGTRESVVNGTPYIAVYRIEGQTVAVLRVLHGARRWPLSPG